MAPFPSNSCGPDEARFVLQPMQYCQFAASTMIFQDIAYTLLTKKLNDLSSRAAST